MLSTQPTLMKRIAAQSLVLSCMMLSCNGAALADGAVLVASAVPYAEDNNIRRKITNSCTTLGSKLSGFIEANAQKNGLSVQLSDSIDPSAAPRVLQVEITEAVSQGNAFIGHRKFVAVAGTLYENGSVVASFDGQRSSGGGFAAGYKSSCAVLGRCVKALGKDIAAWLANPIDEAELGE